MSATESEALAHLDTPGHHLAFLGAPLSRDLRVLGAPSLRVRLTSPCDYTTLAVSLVDVDPAQISTQGATLATDPSQLVAMTRKGHRIALVVQTEAGDWVVPRPCAGALPLVDLVYANGASALTLPLG